MTAIVDAALGLWGLDGAEYRLIAARENAVYEVRSHTKRYALRLHRQGYRSNSELSAELAWMDAVSKGGLSVPSPLPARDGQMLQRVDDVQVDVLGWLPGQTLTEALKVTTQQTRADLFFALGRDMATFHSICDAWSPPVGFDRWHWDQGGLLGETPLWDRFWANPGLSADERNLLEVFRGQAAGVMDQVSPSLDYGLIHADLVPDNVLVCDGRLSFIDFDDGGFGHRLFDVATALLKHRSAPDAEGIQASFLTGYQSVRPLDTTHLHLFLALRAATYVGWNITRLAEENGAARNTRFIQTATELAQGWLTTQS